MYKIKSVVGVIGVVESKNMVYSFFYPTFCVVNIKRTGYGKYVVEAVSKTGIVNKFILEKIKGV